MCGGFFMWYFDKLLARSKNNVIMKANKMEGIAMKKLFALWIILLLTAALLAACGCDHQWEEADCNDPQTCSKCGATEGEELGHDYQDPDCENPKTCSRCGKTKGDALGHTWADATCDSPKTCTVCAATEGEALGHTWLDATCTTPKTCSACAATEGEALGHAWVDATCTTPKTCSACAATEGEAAQHSWTEATCTEPKTCSVCSLTDGEALGHTWYEATYELPKTCITCGATEGEPLSKEKSDLGLGYSIKYFNEYIYYYLNANGYNYSTQYYGADEDGAIIYQACSNADNTPVEVYLFYYLCEDHETVESVMVYTGQGIDNEMAKLTGAYMGAAAVVVDPDNAETIMTQMSGNKTSSEDGTTLMYYTEYDANSYTMIVAANGTAGIEILCAITPLSE